MVQIFLVLEGMVEEELMVLIIMVNLVVMAQVH